MRSTLGKRILSALLASVLVLGSLPVTAPAEQTTAGEEIAETTAPTEPETVPETVPETQAAEETESTEETESATEPEADLPLETDSTAHATGTVIASGSCGADGDNVTYVLTDDGTLTISGSGAMGDYPLWYDNSIQIKSVIIEQGVTSIGDGAFAYRSSLASATISNSVTSIGDEAFAYCGSLASVTIPNGVTSIGEWAFAGCSSLASMTIPNGVTSVGDHVFAGCSSLNSVTIPNSVTSIGDAAFNGCSSLTSVAIPNSVTSIGSSAFVYCGSLTSVTIPDSVTSIGDHTFSGCSSLASVTIPNSVTSIGDDTFDGCSSLASVTIPNSITSIGNCAFWGCSSLTSVTIPSSVTSIGKEAFYGCTELKDVYYTGTETQWSQITIGSDNSELINATIHYNMAQKVSQCGKEQPITINHSGRAYAYYKCAPETAVCYTVNGTEGTAGSDEKGIIKVPLGEYSQPGEYTVAVAFTKIGDETLSRAMEFTEKVNVEPLSFKQSWKASLDRELGVKISAGGGFEIPLLEAEATLGQVKGSAKMGNALNISRGYSVSGETLELTSEKSAEAGRSVKSGITGDFMNAEISLLDLSEGTAGKASGTYGIKFNNYMRNSSAQQRAIATFLLGEALESMPNSLLLKPLHKELAKTVYKDSGCDVIQGSSSALTGTVKAGAVTAKVNDVDLFTLAKGSAKFTVSSSRDYSTSGEVNYETSMKTDKNLSLICSDIPGSNDSTLSIQLLKKNFMGRDIKVTAKTGSDGKCSLSANTLSAYNSDPQILIFRQTTAADYTKYQFEDETLKQLCENTKNISSYLDGTYSMLSDRDMAQIAGFISNSKDPIPYTVQAKQTTLDKIPLRFGLDLIAGGSIGVDLSYMEESSYSRGSGYALEDQLLQTSESPDLSDMASRYGESLDEMAANCLNSIASDVKNFFTEVVGAIKDGVSDIWSWVKEKADSTKDWIITITSASSGSAWAESYSIDTYAVDGRDIVMPEGVSGDDAANYELTKAATIGRPFLISVTDASGNAVTDLSSEPLEYTIRYADTDLQAAGLSRSSSIVRSGGIAMYRYSDDGDYFEYVGGTNDLDAMTVTATITKPGQYILAVDSCAPALSSLDVSDYHTNPTITARITDMTGLDLGSFRFTLDGQCMVDGASIADHFNKKTGIFTYTVPENMPLSEGEHTMSFTLSDTSGNAQTYTFNFPVDLTVPEITQYSAEGHPNEGSIVEIEAQVSDANLTEVCALLAKRLPDGTWTDEVPVKMGDMGDGSWKLEYEGGGSSIRVRVQATDIAGNTAESEAIELRPIAEKVTISQEYVLLYEGNSTTLKAEVIPSELSGSIIWSVEKGGEDVVVVDEAGNVTAKQQGTAYILASIDDGQKPVSARCRIDVAPRIPIMGVQLGTTAVTMELFRTDYSEFDVILLLDQNKSRIMTANAIAPYSAAPENNGIAIDSAGFVDEKTANLFDLIVKDDRTLLVVPKRSAVGTPKSVAGRYTSKVKVTVDEREYITDTALTLTVKKSTPKLKAAALTFNPFYTEQFQTIQITGATVRSITQSTLPDWLMLENGVLSLNNAPNRGSAKAIVSVQTEEWVDPVTVSVSVKLSYAAPKLKLSASSAVFAAGEAYKESRGVTLKLQCANRNDTLEGLNVSGIQAPEGFEIRNFDRTNGSFILKPTEAVAAGTKEITVSFLGTTQTVILKPRISTKTVSLTAKPSTVTLNSVVGDSAAIPLTASPADYRISGVNIRLTGSKGEEVGQDLLACEYGDGFVIVRTVKDKTQPNTTYKLHIATKDTAKETVLTVKTLADTAKTKPAVSAKVVGSIDLSLSDASAVVTPVFKYYTSGAFKDVKWTVAESKGKTLVGDATAKFNFTPIPGTNRLLLSAKEGLVPGNSYLLSLTYTLSDDSACSCTAKITVKRTPVKLKLSKTSISLNKALCERQSVDVVCLTKGYNLTGAVWEIIPEKNAAADGLSVEYLNSGSLRVSANASARPGTSYTVRLRATADDTPVNLTVKIPAGSTVSASLKAKGTIDVVRGGSSAVLTPAVFGCAGQAMMEGEYIDLPKQIRIQSSSDSKWRTFADVTDSFVISRNNDGTYTITRKSGAAVDASLKYRAELTFPGLADSKPAYTNLTVRSCTAKVEVSNGIALYKSDRFSRDTFRLTAVDQTVDSIIRVEIKDPKYRKMFEVYSYGNGEFAIGFANNAVPDEKLPASLVLNVYTSNAQYAKPAASVTLKIKVL